MQRVHDPCPLQQPKLSLQPHRDVKRSSHAGYGADEAQLGVSLASEVSDSMSNITQLLVCQDDSISVLYAVLGYSCCDSESAVELHACLPYDYEQSE